MVSGEQEDGNTRFQKAPQALRQLTLLRRAGISGLVGVSSKKEQVHAFADRVIHRDIHHVGEIRQAGRTAGSSIVVTI